MSPPRDGTYGNPDRETLEMIEKARPQGGFTVHLTYSAESCDATHKDWLKDRKEGPFDPTRSTPSPTSSGAGSPRGRSRSRKGPVRLAL